MGDKHQKNDIRSHHAFIVPGVLSAVRKELYRLIETSYGTTLAGNPDFWCGEFEVFGIGDGRFLRDIQMRKAIGGGEKIFVLGTNFITREAQNALLKVFEEPASGTRFFVVTPWPERLLPTLRSRMVELRCASATTQEGEYAGFLANDAAGRLAAIQSIIEEKDKVAALLFLDEVEKALYEQFISDGAKTSYIAPFELIMETRSYLHDRAPSVKMLLENVALSLPRIRTR